MMNYIWVFMIIFSYIFSFFAGTTDAVTQSVFQGAQKGVDTCLSLIGMMCLWTGILEVAEKSHLTKKIEKLFLPITRFLFPSIPSKSEEMSAIVMNMTANLLGLSNAATPLGLAAMEKLSKRNLYDSSSSDDICMFVVINTASITLIPTTLLTLRAAAGSVSPTEILLPVWICSLFSVLCGVVSAKLLSRRWK